MSVVLVGLLAIADGSSSLQEACAAHRASVSMIETAHVRVRLTLHDRPQSTPFALPEPCSGGEYWRKGDLVRVRESYGPSRNDWLLDGSYAALVTTTRDPQGRIQHGASRRRREKGTANLDVWERALLSFNRQPLDSYLAEYKTAINISREEFDGIGCVVITVADRKRKTKHSIWLDPSVNCLARLSRTEFADGTILESLVKNFREHAPGVYFPSVIEKRYEPAAVRGERRWRETAEILDVRINQPLPDAAFRLDYADGTVFVDEVNGTYFHVGRDGRPSEPAKPLGRDIIDSPDAQGRTQTPADYEDRPISAILIGSIAITFSLALGIIAYRHRRRN